MKIGTDPTVHLTYCLNIHAGESLQDVVNAIGSHTSKVRDSVSGGAPFGLGLRLGAEAAEELKGEALEQFRSLLTQEDMYVFTMNGFPYGGFHGKRVKENVYAPDWCSVERTEYTSRLVSVLGELLPDGVEGSISTVPVSYASWINGDEAVNQAVRNLMGVVWDCVRLEERCGRKISLALEPEPDCYVQSVSGAVEFFNNYLLVNGVDLLAAQSGMAESDCESAIRRHLGVCFDTCHSAVQFEDVVDGLLMLEMEGIVVPKVQLSSAVKATMSAKAREELKDFVDSVYLHQTRTRHEGIVHEHMDLTADLLDNIDDGTEIRTHFHVPLWFESQGEISGTAQDIPNRFFEMLKAGITEHIEVETYTFDVLPGDLRAMKVDANISRELEWARDRIA